MFRSGFLNSNISLFLLLLLVLLLLGVGGGANAQASGGAPCSKAADWFVTCRTCRCFFWREKSITHAHALIILALHSQTVAQAWIMVPVTTVCVLALLVSVGQIGSFALSLYMSDMSRSISFRSFSLSVIVALLKRVVGMVCVLLLVRVCVPQGGVE